MQRAYDVDDRGLLIEDDETVALLDRLCEMLKVNRVEALQIALQDALDRNTGLSPFQRKALAFSEDFNRRYPPTGKAADKAFIDDLYED